MKGTADTGQRHAEIESSLRRPAFYYAQNVNNVSPYHFPVRKLTLWAIRRRFDSPHPEQFDPSSALSDGHRDLIIRV
jgi:hypothetical protein